MRFKQTVASQKRNNIDERDGHLGAPFIHMPRAPFESFTLNFCIVQPL